MTINASLIPRFFSLPFGMTQKGIFFVGRAICLASLGKYARPAPLCVTHVPHTRRTLSDVLALGLRAFASRIHKFPLPLRGRGTGGWGHSVTFPNSE